MILYYSGNCENDEGSNAERLAPGVSIMLSYNWHHGRADREKWRIRIIQKEREMLVYYSGGEQEGWRKEVHPHPMLSSYKYLTEKPDGGGEQVMKTGACVKSHFLDSGAFTMWTRAREYAKENDCSQWDFYDTEEFWKFIDGYAEFVKKYQSAIDLYANMDAIPHPALSWRNQKYLEEKHGLKPVPVVHRGTNLKWLRRYMDAGYEVIGLGGMVGTGTVKRLANWLDECFEVICDTPDRLPKVKVHGFGVTSYSLLTRYPWASVDSVTWAKAGGFGRILVPHLRGGKFDFSEDPYVIATSIECKKVQNGEAHILNLTGLEKRIVDKWLAEIDVPLGKFRYVKKDGKEEVEVLEQGVITYHACRRAACIMFFEKLCEWLPVWPWPFERRKEKLGFHLL